MQEKQYSVNKDGYYTHVVVIGPDHTEGQVREVLDIFKKAKPKITPFVMGDGEKEVTLEKVEQTLTGRIGEGTKIHMWGHGNSDKRGNHSIWLGKEGIPTKSAFSCISRICGGKKIDLVLSSCHSDETHRVVNSLPAGSTLITTSPEKESTLIKFAPYDAELVCHPGDMATNFLECRHPSYNKRMSRSEGGGKDINLADPERTFQYLSYEAYLAKHHEENKIERGRQRELLLTREAYRQKKIKEGREFFQKKGIPMDVQRMDDMDLKATRLDRQRMRLDQAMGVDKGLAVVGHFNPDVLNDRGYGKLTPLMEAAGRSQKDVVEKLLSSGVNACLSLSDKSPYDALYYAQIGVTKLLLKGKRKEVDEAYAICTMLEEARQLHALLDSPSPTKDTFDQLGTAILRKKTSAHLVNKSGASILHCYLTHTKPGEVTMGMVEQFAQFPLEKRDGKDRTALHVALKYGHGPESKVVGYLAEQCVRNGITVQQLMPGENRHRLASTTKKQVAQIKAIMEAAEKRVNPPAKEEDKDREHKHRVLTPPSPAAGIKGVGKVKVAPPVKDEDKNIVEESFLKFLSSPVVGGKNKIDEELSPVHWRDRIRPPVAPTPAAALTPRIKDTIINLR